MATQIDEDQPDEKAYYIIPGTGNFISASFMGKLTDLINKYDVALTADVARKQSDGVDSIASVAVGLANLHLYLDRKSKKYHSIMDAKHPGGKGRYADKYRGLTFGQIFAKAGEGKECHNEIAEALRECLSTYKPADM